MVPVPDGKRKKATLMSNSFDSFLVKAMRGKRVAEILNASPAGLAGVSSSDARKLEEAFGIRTIRDLARNRFFHRALALLAASGEIGFDPGPPFAWESFFNQAPLDYYLQHPARRFRLDFGPVWYRGRLDGSARLLVVGQDPSTNEILAHRVFVGRSGQRVQGFLKKLGVTRSYLMMNMFLFSVFGQVDAQLRAIALEEAIFDFRNAFLDRLAKENRLQAVMAVGSGASFVLKHWPGAKQVPVLEIMHPAAPDEAALLASWNRALAKLRPMLEPDEGQVPEPHPYGRRFLPEDHAPIPRNDLPFGLPDWHGTGAHSAREGNKKIIWTAP
jgi:uracil-DNA glycosylase